jgi:diguanylate cyclase (GGDEF)-like protein
MDVISRDVTERRERERKLAQLTRIHAVLSGINSIIVRVRSRDELFRDACRIAVGAGQFRMAWVGIVDREAMQVKPVAWDGEVRGFFDNAPLAVTETEGPSLVGQAVREKKPVISNDVQNDPQRLMKKECLERGINSLAALPLLVGGEAVAVLTLYAGELGFFDSEEMKLLGELAGDITFGLEHIGQEERLTYLAYYDALTSLPNRTLFHERLTQLLHAAEHSHTQVIVAAGDINRFRLINDTFGRQAGDALLCEFAQRLRTLWPEPDHVARISADIFACALADVRDPSTIAYSIDKTVAAILEAPFAVKGKEVRIATTAGVAVFPTDGEDADTLFRNAEAALKKAKASGERYLFYRPEMNSRVAETLLLENKLRQAIKLNQFVLHYQPKVDGTSGRVSGLEALIRWQDPETGLVPPLKFIPILEETGMILEVGQWAIRKALEDSRRWRMKDGRPPRIAVNVSPIQLQQRDFVEVVKRAVEEAGGEGCQLDLEITEGLIMLDIEENIKKLSAIREMGLQIAIDDFGTGYSSLAYLAKLPVNALKIDRSFIITMTSNPQSMTIVSTIISLAHSLGLKVIAEGVDAEEQAKFLKLLRCDEMQGYLFSRPAPPDKIEDLLNRSGSEGSASA